MGNGFVKLQRTLNGVDASDQRRAGNKVDLPIPKGREVGASRSFVTENPDVRSVAVPANEVHQLHEVPKLNGSSYSCFVMHDGGATLRAFYQMVRDNSLVGKTVRLEIFNQEDSVALQKEGQLFSIGMSGKDKLQINLSQNNQDEDITIKSPDDAGKRVRLSQI